MGVRVSSPVLRFRDCQLDPAQFELRRGGHRIRLERKPLEMLIFLAEKQGQLVSREEIIERIWGRGVFFDAERGVNNAIRKIRSALHDNPENPAFLETVVGKGYRFVASVEIVTPAAAPIMAPESSGSLAANSTKHEPSSWRPALLAGIAVLALLVYLGTSFVRKHSLPRSDLTGVQSLAVLPLENLSGDPAQDYFADGMTDALITDLAKLGNLRVISRTSTMRYRGQRKPLPEIARELSVDAVIEGTVVRAGNKVRITAQLIQAKDDVHLWADSFESSSDDVISLQDEVARAIAGRVQGRLSSSPAATAGSRRRVRPDAYEAYLRGRYLFDRREERASRKSVDYFRQAISADPSFPPAYAGLAEALPASNWFSHQPPIGVMEEAKAAARQALKLDDSLGEAHTALGSLLSLYDWNWSAAEKELKRGLALNPNNSLAHERYAMWLQSQGRVDEAVREAQQAQALDPVSFFMNREVAVAFYFARRYDDALQQLQRAQELGPPNSAVVTLWVRQSYENLGRRDDAIDVALREAIDGQTTSPTIAGEAALLKKAYATGGWSGYWTKWIELHSSGPQPTTQPYFLALAEARLGHADKVWAWMQKSADQREVWVTWIKVDPLLDNARSSPEYPKLLRRLHLAQ
jgi:TolB-like protein/DNA-binding winged helix-turn-helix (wHTH) protein